MATSASLSSASITGLGLSGLSSGLDTSGIITKLMAIESGPQTALKTKLTSATAYRSALQSLNASVAAIAATATSAARAGALDSFTATSDATSVKATASSSASAGDVSFTVDQIAKAQVSVSRPMSAWPAPADPAITTPSITIQVGAGAPKTFTATSTRLDDVADAINRSGTGITATKIAIGTTGGVAQYRLQLRGASGDGNAFSVYQGADTSATKLETTETQTAQSAKITLYADSDAEQQIVSPINSFDDLLTGVRVSVSSVSSTPVTVSVAADPSAATSAAQALTSSLATLFSGISAATAVSTTTSASGTTSATSGSVFTGDGLVRALKDSLLSAASGAVEGRSPSAIGINLTKEGTITFDPSKFASAMADDPIGTASMFQTIAGRVAKASSAASAPYSGTISQRITSQQTAESSLTKEIGDWDSRLAVIQAQYTTQFNNLETALNSLSSQSNYLTGQINGLTTNYQKS